MIEETDAFRERYVAEVTGREWLSAVNYHLTLDTSVFSLQEAADLVVEAVRRRTGRS